MRKGILNLLIFICFFFFVFIFNKSFFDNFSVFDWIVLFSLFLAFFIFSFVFYFLFFFIKNSFLLLRNLLFPWGRKFVFNSSIILPLSFSRFFYKYLSLLFLIFRTYFVIVPYRIGLWIGGIYEGWDYHKFVRDFIVVKHEIRTLNRIILISLSDEVFTVTRFILIFPVSFYLLFYTFLSYFVTILLRIFQVFSVSIILVSSFFYNVLVVLLRFLIFGIYIVLLFLFFFISVLFYRKDYLRFLDQAKSKLIFLSKFGGEGFFLRQVFFILPYFDAFVCFISEKDAFFGVKFYSNFARFEHQLFLLWRTAFKGNFLIFDYVFRFLFILFCLKLIFVLLFVF